MMNLQWYDFAGFVGTFVILAAYFGLQVRRLHGNGATYALLNLIGAIGILISVAYAPTMNWSVLFIECAWILISVYGLWNSARTRLSRPAIK